MAFFVEDADIYILCKDTPDALLTDAGQQIASHIAEKTGAETSSGHWLIYDDTSLLTAQEELSRQPSRFTKVLLVEDDPVTRWMVRTALKGQCTLLTATTAGSAIETYHKCQPDLVFLDLNLPDRNGRDVLNNIFKDDPRANVVMFSSQGNVETMLEMLETGACGFVAKPFTKKRLLSYVRNLA